MGLSSSWLPSTASLKKIINFKWLYDYMMTISNIGQLIRRRFIICNWESGYFSQENVINYWKCVQVQRKSNQTFLNMKGGNAEDGDVSAVA